MRTPSSTYRLQITERLRPVRGGAAAALPARPRRRLGLPVAAAGRGARQRPRLRRRRPRPHRPGARRRGGPRRRCRPRRAGSGMGVLVDIVPNHVGVATPRPRTRGGGTCSTHGRESRRTPARSTSTGRPVAAASRIPVLGDDDLARRRPIAHLEVGDGELRYHDHALPARSRHRRRRRWTPGRARPAALRAGQLAGGRRRPQLPPVLRGQHASPRSGSRTPRCSRIARRDPALVRRGPRRRAAGRPPRRPARPRGLPRRPRRADRRRLRAGREDPRARRGAARRRGPTAGTTGYDALALIDRVLTDPAGRGAAGRARGPAPRRRPSTGTR